MRATNADKNDKQELASMIKQLLNLTKAKICVIFHNKGSRSPHAVLGCSRLLQFHLLKDVIVLTLFFRINNDRLIHFISWKYSMKS